ncbi:SPFH domain-containing protein [Desulfofustis glycolicus]|uniref:Membrane protease subunit, stomatin/prohibitin family, contains C-terminal Zn-ribbon domain n=1 Tax=Desulfofustis glycolicus DSM 9705 TaxID=1121409 RepID=A0A1M5X8Y0_9BACT|nr:SPFH domain-containing protein [Desulfofustis glycolicus]MCB2218110.1 SPFH domain-containing protein [Desulfobulbaceae bacterium]SHH96038.1 Membrane protease subunit, stomatin/prohibitin family, contains C-terminal Zn-ribbon domain [Desulfofustis glycolicus DSM 9705]
MNRFDGGVFLENIEWFDETGQELVHRLPEHGSGEIKWGAQLTVRESQAAVLFYQGKARDAFGPGRFTLKTANLPIITKILSIPWRGDSPLRAEVYMVNLKYFPNLKWGTTNPVAFRDSEMGLIRLRAHGIFNIQVVQPILFINSLVGTMGRIGTEEVASYLKRVIVSRFNDYLGENLDTILNLPGRFDELSVELQKKLTLDFAHFGLRLSHLYITSITPPEEVQKAIDDQSRMSVIKDMEKFVKLKAAMAMEKAAENQGEAGAGLGLGIGMMMPAMFSAAAAGRTGGSGGIGGGVGTAGRGETTTCPDCQNPIPAAARFCPLCGHQVLVLSQCSSCGKNLSPNAKYCSRCGTATEQSPSEVHCRECGTENLPGATFCNQCGHRLG